MDNLKYLAFKDINLDDVFFKSLKCDYEHGFIEWFNKKANDRNEKAYVLYDEDKGENIDGFLYLKIEDGIVKDVIPNIKNGKHLKVGTFKFNRKGTLRGQRFLKKIFDNALSFKVDDIYVTVFSKHKYLIDLFKKYGFKEYAKKKSDNGEEIVLLKDMISSTSTNNIFSDYPRFTCTKKQNKYILSIYPEFHSILFPDSILKNESNDILQDISHTNSIRKVYICKMDAVKDIKPNDIIVIYRTTDIEGQAHYRSVVTSVCIVEDVKNIDDFKDENDFIQYCIRYSVFEEKVLSDFYRKRKFPYIISFTYNLALPKRPNRASLIDDVGIDRKAYWGILKISDKQFNDILKLSEADESIIIN